MDSTVERAPQNGEAMKLTSLTENPWDTKGNHKKPIGNQKETLTTAKSKVEDTQDITNRANNLLVMMGNRAIRHKICLVLIILVLAGCNGLVVYYGFQNKK